MKNSKYFKLSGHRFTSANGVRRIFPDVTPAQIEEAVTTGVSKTPAGTLYFIDLPSPVKKN